jgi:MarR family transcriptional regulator for hemolysin
MNKATYLPRDFTGDLVIAGRLWRRMTRVVTARHDIAEAGAAPLLWISRMGEGVRQNALAARVGVEGASLVRVLDELAAAGLITRIPDPSDRRANLLHLTALGRKKTAQVEFELSELRERVFGGLAAGDIAAAQRVIAAIASASAELPTKALELAD